MWRPYNDTIGSCPSRKLLNSSASVTPGSSRKTSLTARVRCDNSSKVSGPKTSADPSSFRRLTAAEFCPCSQLLIPPRTLPDLITSRINFSRLGCDTTSNAFSISDTYRRSNVPLSSMPCVIRCIRFGGLVLSNNSLLVSKNSLRCAARTRSRGLLEITVPSFAAHLRQSSSKLSPRVIEHLLAKSRRRGREGTSNPSRIAFIFDCDVPRSPSNLATPL